MSASEHSWTLAATAAEGCPSAPAYSTLKHRCLLVEPPAVSAGCSLQHVRCTFALEHAVTAPCGAPPVWQQVLVQLQVLVVSKQQVVATHPLQEVLCQQQHMEDAHVLLHLRVPISNCSNGVAHISLAPTTATPTTSSSSAGVTPYTINLSCAAQLLVVPSSAAADEAAALLDSMAKELSALQQQQQQRHSSSSIPDGHLQGTSGSSQPGASPIHTARQVLAAAQAPPVWDPHCCADSKDLCGKGDTRSPGCITTFKEGLHLSKSSMAPATMPGPHPGTSPAPTAAVAGARRTAACTAPAGHYGAWVAAEQRRQEVLHRAWHGHMKALLLDLTTALGAAPFTAADGDLLLPLEPTPPAGASVVCHVAPIPKLLRGAAQQRPAMCVPTITTTSHSSGSGSSSSSRRRRSGGMPTATSGLQADPAAQMAVSQRLLSFLSGRGHWCLYGWLLSSSVRTGALGAAQLNQQARLVHSLGAAEAAAAAPVPVRREGQAASGCWLPSQPEYALVLESLPPHMGLLAEGGACPELLG